ncbi:MAG: hypothetical protein LBT39_01085, partial [Treponema sp.]|nr:hypothetical protein [Treponema sp.]
MSDSFFPTDQFARGPRGPRLSDEEINADYNARMDERRQNIQKYGGADLSNEEFAFLNDFERNPERYRIDLSNDDFALINQAFPNEQSNREYVDNRYRVATAIQLARLYSIPFHTAFSFEDDILESQYDERIRNDPKSAFKAVSDSFALGTNQLKLADLGGKLLLMGAGEERDRLWQEVQAIKRENEGLGDGVTRNMFIEGLKGLGESWAFTASAGAAGFLGGLINPALGAVASGVVSAAQMTGLEYINLLDQGIDEDVARPLAAASGAIQGILEAALGDIPALGSRTGLGQWIFKKLHYSGKIGSIGRVLMGRAGDTLMEGFEEAAQEITSQVFVEMGKDEMEERFGIVLDRDLPEEQLRQIAESFKGGLLTSMILGVPVMLRDGAVTRREAALIREAQVTSSSAEELKEKIRTLPFAQNMNEESLDEVSREAFSVGQGRLQRETAAEEERLRKERLYGSVEAADGTLTDREDTSGRIYRDDNGRLYIRNSTRRGSNGVTEGIARIGNPNKAEANTYMEIRYEVRDGGYHIEEVRTAENAEGIRDEGLQRFADKVGGQVAWEGRSFTPAEGAGAGTVPAAGVNTAAAPAVAANFAEQVAPQIGREAAGVVYRMAEFFREKEGITVDEWLSQTDITSDPEAVIQRAEQEITRTAAANGQTLDPAELRSRAEQMAAGKRGATFNQNLGDTTRRIVYIGKTGDFSTLNHELLHDYILRLPETGRREWEAAIGLDDGDWNTPRDWGGKYQNLNAHEYLAEAWEDYLSQGKAPDPKLQTLFDRIKAFMEQVYRSLRDLGDLKPELKKKFDELFSGDQAGQADAAPQTAAGREGGDAPGKDDGKANGAAPTETLQSVIDDTTAPFADRAEAAVEQAGAEYADALWQGSGGPVTALIQQAGAIADPAERDRVIGELRDLARRYPPETNQYLAPNGKPSRLIAELGERQGQQAWYAVRTPSFKRWFGDWEQLAAIEAVQSMKPINIAIPSITEEEVSTVYKAIGERKNQFTGQKAAFVHHALGKILRHKGFDPRIVSVLGNAYEEAYHTYDEEVNESHKKHPNFTGYSNYVSKVSLDGKDYFVRFTLQNLRTKQESARKSEFHSAFVSDVEIYNAVDSRVNSMIIDMARPETNGITDNKLMQWFDSVKPSEVSKIIDENGEPLPVYHGTGREFDEFNNESGLSAYYFTAEKRRAETYAQMKGDDNGIVMQSFLDIKNPIELSSEEIKKDVIESYIDGEHDGATSKFGGVYIAFSPTQIKSATDNAGTYDPRNPSILFQDDAFIQSYRDAQLMQNPELIAYAASFRTWEDFKFDAELGWGKNPQGIPGGADDAWYQSVWE